MKFRFAVVSSVILHFSLFAIAYFFPGMEKTNGTTYYVDLINLGSGNDIDSGKIKHDNKGSDKSENTLLEEKNRVKNLTVKKKIKSKLRFPDKKSRKKKEKKDDSLISVVRKKKVKKKELNGIVPKVEKRGILKTGISGNGSGSGHGGVPDNFPYGYYIDTLKNRISSSWYNPLASSGISGSYNVMVYFKIFRDGSIGSLKIIQKSGKKLFDMSALRVIKEVSPFPPLPSDYPDFYLGVYFEFEWKK